jgi:hypothetical protein
LAIFGTTHFFVYGINKSRQYHCSIVTVVLFSAAAAFDIKYGAETIPEGIHCSGGGSGFHENSLPFFVHHHILDNLIL